MRMYAVYYTYFDPDGDGLKISFQAGKSSQEVLRKFWKLYQDEEPPIVEVEVYLRRAAREAPIDGLDPETFPDSARLTRDLNTGEVVQSWNPPEEKE